MPVFLTTIGLAGLVVLFLVRKLPKVRALCALVVGLAVAYGSTSALVTRFTAEGAHAALGAGGKLGAMAFGWSEATVASAIALALVFLVGHDLLPKHHAKMRTTICALLLPIIAVNVGGAVSHATNTVRTSVVQTANLTGR